MPLFFTAEKHNHISIFSSFSGIFSQIAASLQAESKKNYFTLTELFYSQYDFLYEKYRPLQIAKDGIVLPSYWVISDRYHTTYYIMYYYYILYVKKSDVPAGR